jgi:hypothetical protein
MAWMAEAIGQEGGQAVIKVRQTVSKTGAAQASILQLRANFTPCHEMTLADSHSWP